MLIAYKIGSPVRHLDILFPKQREQILLQQQQTTTYFHESLVCGKYFLLLFFCVKLYTVTMYQLFCEWNICF